MMMENSRATTLLLLVLVLCYGVTVTMGLKEEGEGSSEWEEKKGEDWFLLHDSKHVVKTDAGDLRVVKNFGGRFFERPMHIGFLTMEPRSLFIPQYLDCCLIIFIRRGAAKIGLIYKGEMSERNLKMGDIYRIPAGSAFYLVNTEGGQRLHVVCSIVPSEETFGFGAFQSFFIGGGTYPSSVLAGFEPETLAVAFNVTKEAVRELLTRQTQGPIIFLDDSKAPSLWSKYFEMKEKDRLKNLKRMMNLPRKEEEETSTSWSWRKLLNSLLGENENEKNKHGSKGKSPDSYNVYKKTPDFKNNYGFSIFVGEADYKSLSDCCIGVYLVNLSAGGMMAPHVNPGAAEYGIVLSGTGEIQIVYPNGTQAMRAKVTEGQVFWIPRYLAFCQIASKTGPFVFFGFTTSCHHNSPQFFAGENSLLSAMIGPELAAAFGMSEQKLRNLTSAQKESVILPSTGAAPPDYVKTTKEEVNFEKVPRMMKNFANEMILDFN